MAKTTTRIGFAEALLALALAAMLARSFQIQVVQHGVWARRARETRARTAAIAPRRGRIFDRDGRLLAVSEEEFRVSISLNEVKDTAALRAQLIRSLGIPRERVAAAFRGRYPYFYGPFSADQVEPIRTLRGVHFTVLYDRVYPNQSLALPILGGLDPDGGHGVAGIERVADTLLAGKPGAEEYLVDGRGNRLEMPGPALREPIAGRDVYLTIDAELQGIAEAALANAVEDAAAKGGDIVLLDVRSGEFLAIASLRRDSASGRMVSTASALVEPNEPGSTSKLFTIAGLLRNGVDTTPVDGEGGHWAMHIGRTVRNINDVEPHTGPVTLGETVKYSSNIAISKYALRLTPDQQYEALRDFGFGTPLGLGFPGEAQGVLDRPARWVNPLYSQPSLGQGYEWEATAAQLASGYGAIADGGVLMQTALLREVRDQNGTVLWRHTADTIRRAIPPSVDARLMSYLALATDTGGTGAEGQLDRFRVVGKTGTADIGKRRGYRSSFVAIFSEDDPQLVVYIMIDQPSKIGIFGGKVAAPIEREILLQALSVLHTPLDLSPIETDVTVTPAPAPGNGAVPMHAVSWPLARMDTTPRPSIVPPVAGTTVRDAVVALERSGFAIRLEGWGRVRSTMPAAGDTLASGSVVTLSADTLP